MNEKDEIIDGYKIMIKAYIDRISKLEKGLRWYAEQPNGFLAKEILGIMEEDKK